MRCLSGSLFSIGFRHLTRIVHEPCETSPQQRVSSKSSNADGDSNSLPVLLLDGD